jgi:hypothetical protein
MFCNTNFNPCNINPCWIILLLLFLNSCGSGQQQCDTGCNTNCNNCGC